MKRFSVILLSAAIVGLPGCWRKKQKAEEPKPEKEIAQVEVRDKEVEIPVADAAITNLFDEDIGEFALVDDTQAQAVAKAQAVDDYSWVDEQKVADLQVIYFDFDHYEIRPDQENAVRANVAKLKKAFDEALVNGVTVTIVVDGHACHSAGSRAYNLALSERRAKVLADVIVDAGIPCDSVKIVARGSEFPAIIDGKPVEGDRQEQWPNRRDEIRIIYS